MRLWWTVFGAPTPFGLQQGRTLSSRSSGMSDHLSTPLHLADAARHAARAPLGPVAHATVSVPCVRQIKKKKNRQITSLIGVTIYRNFKKSRPWKIVKKNVHIFFFIKI